MQKKLLERTCALARGLEAHEHDLCVPYSIASSSYTIRDAPSAGNALREHNDEDSSIYKWEQDPGPSVEQHFSKSYAALQREVQLLGNTESLCSAKDYERMIFVLETTLQARMLLDTFQTTSDRTIT